MSALTGRSLQQGKYTVEQELGRGGFGITYKARNNVLAQAVVIKTINDSLHQDPQFLKHQSQFHDEARRLAKCFHPNIVRVTDFFTEDGLPYIVMDYIPGETLDKLVQPGRPLPEARALAYIFQVGEAVEAIHRAGLLHRDIKPQNLILQPETQRVMLIDFGIAREFTPGIVQAHTHLVSEGYAPIEQYLPQAQRSQATDIYGLAATLYTLLTAQVPVAAILRDRAPLQPPHQIQPTVSPAVSAAVMQGMAVEPHERPKQVSDWLALLSGKHGHPGSVSPGPVSQVATVVVAPGYRPTVPVQRGAATSPAPRQNSAPETESATPPLGAESDSMFSWWLPAVVALAVVVPFGVGYSLWRGQAAPSTPTETSPAVAPTPIDTPSPIEQERSSPEITDEQLRPQPTDQQPSPQPTEASPQPTEASEEEAPPLPSAPSAPSESDPQAEPSPPELPPELPSPATEAQPTQSRPTAETSEESRREEERAREEERRQEERANEEEQRERQEERERPPKPEKKPDKKEKNAQGDT
ncbi:MAG TPA: protein kinase [Leptolyngbyaceae cyanobacterium]